ncbi:GDSL-type esterase/lipase family protein [Demequina sp. SO4-13]|uniref:GDSL-type esterase/lipase family protein n=1 Tax=Demequina sp. SO4-13 TaxID=3401027 RepID=UPI003AF480F3
MAAPAIVALGDSITLGVGDGIQASGGDVGWAAHTARALGATMFLNLAANGTRAGQLAHSQLPLALAARPDVVLVTAGGNDVLRGDFDAVRVELDLRETLEQLSAPGRAVVTVTLDRIGLFDLLPRAVAAVMARRVAAANGAIRGAAVATGTIVVDGALVFRQAGAAAWHIDRIHPSAAGHRAIAAAAVAQLSSRWSPLGPIELPPPPPRTVDRAKWLIRNGAPWAARRSRDLIPQVAQAVTHEMLEDRRARLRGAVRA